MRQCGRGLSCWKCSCSRLCRLMAWRFPHHSAGGAQGSIACLRVDLLSISLGLLNGFVNLSCLGVCGSGAFGVCVSSLRVGGLTLIV